ncbi:MAG: acyl-ACP--UDP-N-acetylglucosamine O-acyltransferase [Pseudomonadota bacterium]
MTAKVHPSSVVHDGAQIGTGVEIGPFCEIGAGAVLSDGVKLHGRVTLTGAVHLGEQVEVFSGAALGGRAQSIGSKDAPDTGVVVGARSVLRECVTIHAGLPDHNRYTRLGEDCYMMAYCHLGHDCDIGDNNVMANCVQYAGHIKTGRHVWAGGSAAVHQFTEIGDYAFVGGGAILVEDVIPFGMVAGNRASLQGLNIRGLTRRGFTRSDLHEVRRAYKAIFQGSGTLLERMQRAEIDFSGNSNVSQLLEFIRKDRKRPLCLPERV